MLEYLSPMLACPHDENSFLGVTECFLLLNYGKKCVQSICLHCIDGVETSFLGLLKVQ